MNISLKIHSGTSEKTVILTILLLYPILNIYLQRSYGPITDVLYKLRMQRSHYLHAEWLFQ